MPNFLVELTDGRKFQVEADTPPTEADLQQYMGQSEAPKEEPMIDISDTLKAAGQAIGGITTTAPHAFRQLYSGLENPWQRSEGYKESQAGLDKYQQELEAANQAAVKSGDISTSSRGMRQAGQSLGFSAGAMGASLAGGSTAGMAGRYIGGLAGPEGAIAGEAGGRVIGALGASYGAAYRMAGAQFLDDASKEIDAKFMEKLGRLPNKQEQDEAYAELKPLAEAFGHAEAGPEAIGNLAMAKAGKFILGLGIKNIKGLAAGALAKVGAGAGGLATELGGETVTQVEQNRIEQQKNALLSGQAPPEQGPRTLGEYQTALGEVAPATLATMGLIGSVPTAYKAGELAIKAYKQPANAAAAELLHAASVSSDDTELTNKATEEQIQASVDATVVGLGEQDAEEAAAFAENLRRTQEEGEAADVQSAQMRAQEEAAAAQEAADRQAQFEGLSQNEPAITAPVGGAIPAVGQEETATIQPEQQLPDSLGVSEAPQLAADEPTSPEGLVGESEGVLRNRAQIANAAALNSGQIPTTPIPSVFPPVQPTVQRVAHENDTMPLKDLSAYAQSQGLPKNEAHDFARETIKGWANKIVDSANKLFGKSIKLGFFPSKISKDGLRVTASGRGLSHRNGIEVDDSQSPLHAAWVAAHEFSHQLFPSAALPKEASMAVGTHPQGLEDLKSKGKAEKLASDFANWMTRKEFPEHSDKIPSVPKELSDFFESNISPAAQKEPPLTPSGQVANEGGGPVTSNETEAGFQVQPPVETKETPQGEVSSADIESKALENLKKKRPNLKPELVEMAKKYFATDDFDIIRKLPLNLRTDIDHSIQDADPQRKRAQLARDKAVIERSQKEDEDNRKADEEMAKRQAKLTESRRGAWDSVVGTPTGVEMNAVSEADGQESLALVNNSGDVPGVLNAFVGTSSQFLANPENETNFPDLWKILSAGRVDEGNFAYGRAFVFTDGIGVNASDRRNAARLGVTPAVAAVRRVLVHEGLVHRGIYGLPAHLQMLILQWVRQNTTPEQLDNLARDYPQYENWRNNPQQMLGLCEEHLAKTVEKITKFPKDGPLSRLFDLLRDIWRWVTGETGEPTVQNLRDVIKLLKAGVVAADARLVNGGKVDIKASYAGKNASIPAFMRDSLSAAQAMATDGKTSEEIRAVTGWFPGKYDGKMRWEIPDQNAKLKGDKLSTLGKKEAKLGQILNHPELFAAYPDAANIKVQLSDKSGGSFSAPLNLIEVNSKDAQLAGEESNAEVPEFLKPLVAASNQAANSALSVLLHEVQHWIQKKEGFSQGSNPIAESSKADRVKTVTDAQYKLGKSWHAIPASLRLQVKEQLRDRFGSGVLSTTRLDLNDEVSLEALDRWESALQFMPSSEFDQVKEALRGLMDARDAAYEGNETAFGFDRYNRTAGEIEARDVQARQKFTPEQRKAVEPYSSENIAKEDAIVINNQDGIQSSRPSFANPINAELARAAERFRQMNERQAVETPEGLKELFNPNAQGSGTNNKLFEQVVTPQQIRSEIRAAYDRAILGTGSIQTSLQQVFDEAKTQIPTLTERQFGEQLQALYEDGSAFLVPADRSDTMLAAGEKWGVYDASGMPASYVGVMPSEVKASVASNIETALHSSRGLTGKVNEKVKGMAANAYGGIPMQMSLPPFYTSVSSREFYDFMKPMVVSKIDDMVKRGVDEGDVLATVVQPDFTDKVMEGARDDAKDVALSIFFNHGMLLAERKFEALMKSGNVAEADIQRDKIDAWTKWAYDKNHSFGTIGNAIQRVMEDPEYQGMYLLSNFASQLKNSQSDVTKANVGDPAALAKDINDLGQTTKDSSDNDVADALTGLQVDDEIAIGEAALTPENKTLWEETKNYLRTLARLTKARLKILAKNVKASNAAESADAEEARYVQMGLAGVDKLIAATQAKINKNFKKILGIPEAGKTRKPRTPKEESAHPLIARMVARYAAKLGAGTNLDAALAALLPQGPSYRDEIINDVVSGIVGRANRSIKKPKAPGTLTDLTKQLKKILSENIKVEPQSAPEESLGRKALRAFGFVTSNEQLVQEAWDKARAKVGDILREANLVETNESIEDKLNAILGEIPQQLYSTSQARSVIKDALEGTKFDNTNEILSDVKGAREAALKSINDAVEKEGNVDPARWQRDQSYIIHAFDGLVVDIQKAKDAGIAASNKALRDAVFGADAQKALKIIIRKLTAARPGIDAPLAPALAWKRLFEMTQTNQGELKGRMFDIVKDEPAFVNLDNANKQKLADILEKAWDARREQMLTKELERLTRKHRMTKKAAKALNNRPAILRKLDAGYFDYSDLAKLIGEEFGLRPMTAEEIKRAKEISARLAEDIFPHERTKLQDELQQLMVRKKLSLGEMLKAWWITAVLSGPKTAFTIGMSYLSGGFELVGHSMSILLNPKMSAKEKGDVLFDSIKNWWTRLAPEIKNAIMYVATGDKTLQDPAALMQSSFFENQFREEMGRFSYSAAEKMIASDNKLMKAAGWFMTYGSRILNALDAFNYNITKAGSAPLVYALLNNSYKAGSMQTSKLFKEARQEIIDTEYGGTVPANTSRLDAWARNAAYQKLSKLTGMAENMSQVARTGNFTTDPGGLGGWLYNGLKRGDMFLQNKSKAFLEKAQKDLLRSDATWVERGMVGIAEFINAVALQTLPVLGLQFARFVANKLNQTISFIPVAGLIRLKETTGIEGREVHRAMIYRNQAIGVAMLVYMAIKLAEIADEPDDEKRGWGWEGSWSNLTPAEKRQRDATGLKENTIWYRDKNGKRVVVNYINWPISPIIAAMAAMSDQIKYSPEKWAEGGIFKKSVAMAWAIKSAVSETSALSQFSELFGSSMASRDPVEAFSNKAARIVGGYAGGYIPRIFKDIDRMMKPEIHKYEGWENLEKELPFYRRMVGKEYLDIFGNPIAPSAKPTARELVEQPEGEAYKMLGRINSHGVWLAPAVAENRLVGKGGHKREMTDEEANRYVKLVGKGYSDFVIRQGERIISMPKDRAKKYVSEKTEDIRTKAVKQAIRN